MAKYLILEDCSKGWSRGPVELLSSKQILENHGPVTDFGRLTALM